MLVATLIMTSAAVEFTHQLRFGNMMIMMMMMMMMTHQLRWHWYACAATPQPRAARDTASSIGDHAMRHGMHNFSEMRSAEQFCLGRNVTPSANASMCSARLAPANSITKVGFPSQVQSQVQSVTSYHIEQHSFNKTTYSVCTARITNIPGTEQHPASTTCA
jgi:hypothetical protein